MVNGLYLYSTFLVFLTTQSAFTLHVTFTHIHTLMTGATTQGATLLIRRKITVTHSHTQLVHPLGAIWVKYLGQGHIDMWTGGARNQTANLSIGGQLLYLLSHSPLSPQNIVLNLTQWFPFSLKGNHFYIFFSWVISSLTESATYVTYMNYQYRKYRPILKFKKSAVAMYIYR